MVADWCLMKARLTNEVTPREFVELQKQFLQARHMLSHAKQTQLRFRDQKLPFTREDLETICSTIFRPCIKLIESMAAIKVGIDRIVMVGGSSRMPWIQETLRKKFSNASFDTSLNCIEAIASGAALYAGGYCISTEDIRNDIKNSRLRVHFTRNPNSHNIIELYVRHPGPVIGAALFVSVINANLVDAFHVEIQSSKDYHVVDYVKISPRNSWIFAETIKIIQKCIPSKYGVAELYSTETKIVSKYLDSVFQEVENDTKTELKIETKILHVGFLHAMLVLLPGEQVRLIYFRPSIDTQNELNLEFDSRMRVGYKDGNVDVGHAQLQDLPCVLNKGMHLDPVHANEENYRQSLQISDRSKQLHQVQNCACMQEPGNIANDRRVERATQEQA
eukprot:Gregarina_sp_Poly_1__4597@NODE_2462_length_2101_cov_284_977876_g1545_i1_p1_GENE_NODE_2462_length_2101_cov_284_977876_g1545_i1NODE_2462_length_2101_cov_284_977876_g1545_i1_p1_ORF_typecomplete_len406_score55_18HSP70/PF00012_20/8_5e24MreB_Mbl/PF06723_13/0_0052DUF1464/PF07318_12/0_008DUF1464/PF07318_12/2_5e03FGGY_C/PF02782_16/0_008PilM_2/PF11104_8/0_3PilM_2/PF11104_8/1_9e03AlphaC_C/PF17480_2/7_2e03AlphaC_C/PF17480_2/0_44_NODE_2462_length_2101_cov_284_977876_g1545_i18832055